MKEYLVVEFTISPVEPGRDILLANLDLLPYDSFEETPQGLKAYILEQDFNPDELKELHVFNNNQFTISYETDRLENKNWNEEWETYYEPIDIDGQVFIYAPFHKKPEGFLYTIEIMPKMSFGTGHHQTTRLMSRLMLNMNLEGKKVLDMGTGTGILAILASMRGAADILAIDNFEWAVENTAENVERNHCSNIEARLGDAELLKDLHFETVLANINRNVLLEDMKTYIKTLPIGGQLALSGFFEDDFHLLDDEATAHGMELVSKEQEGRWLACLYKKIN
ncbi:MAG: 50S ribosomal protein L11 methyltransferase [Owenweeksia sp.]|nr:50S ribosomal protein L11 methyltransferase [Owenweeksia sp.]MBF98645.1 50S ribosomal protein L11 methyltransferase [Owenweeksia sp.]HBF21919.1 50S ribosomal protein L11 methyltransferase [Cryomorphaceae bacterium]HCQ15687.1 50S ribosomal protein L11 methyltransferase [Cryomorphaceae bacterium]|tara:strand:- start:3025 stop:3864 length:840 start_codon:yes stop_codon:yes gene_type:complete